jgi:hypothetical protein
VIDGGVKSGRLTKGLAEQLKQMAANAQMKEQLDATVQQDVEQLKQMINQTGKNIRNRAQRVGQ